MSPAAHVLRALVRLYQLTLAALFPGSCRFEPSCSHYAMEALKTHGALTGTVLTVRRVLSCNPWGGCGYDPVPPLRRPASRAGGAQSTGHSSTVLRF